MPCGNSGKVGGGGGGAEAVFVFGNQFDRLSRSFLHTRGLGEGGWGGGDWGLGERTAGFPWRHAQLKEQRRDDGHSHTSSAPVTELKERMETHGILLSVSENSSHTCNYCMNRIACAKTIISQKN